MGDRAEIQDPGTTRTAVSHPGLAGPSQSRSPVGGCWQRKAFTFSREVCRLLRPTACVRRLSGDIEQNCDLLPGDPIPSGVRR